jgi:hypothetical protein
MCIAIPRRYRYAQHVNLETASIGTPIVSTFFLDCKSIYDLQPPAGSLPLRLVSLNGASVEQTNSGERKENRQWMPAGEEIQ